MFPHSIEDQVNDLNEKNAYLKANATRLGILSEYLTKLETLVKAVNEVDTIANKRETRSKLDVANRKLAISKAQLFVRKLIEFCVADNDKATEVDYQALRIPKRGPHTLLIQPDDAPGIGHILCKDFIVKVPFFDAKTGKRGKPDGAREIEAYYQKGGDPPKDFRQMSEQMIASSSPMKLKFDPRDYCETLYIVFRWVGTRCNKGPWSEIHEVIIIR
jgi:hypothetical protein